MAMWFQIAEKVREAIREGTLAPGDRLPTEQQFEEFFGVSRTTVRHALEALANEGLIDRVAGRGTFVRSGFVEQPVNRLAGFHEDMRARGLVPSAETVLVQLSTPPPEVASRLGTEGAVIRVERRLKADGESMAYHRSFMPEWVLGPGELWMSSDLEAKSLYELMDERTGSMPRTAEEIIGAAPAPTGIAGELGIEAGTPVLTAERLGRNQFGRPVELVYLWYRADRYRYLVELSR
jgi:GntR family transcriptional regulator